MPKDTTDTPASNTEPDPADAFALVSHELRAEIISLLMEEYELSFGELRSQLASDVGGSQLHYHLNQLAGHFIRRTESGYQIRPEGIRLYLTLRAGALDRQQEHLSFDPECDCHTCNTPLKASFNNGVVRVWCSECDQKYGHDFLENPLAAFMDDQAEFSLSHFRTYVTRKTVSLARGVCPSCAHSLESEFQADDQTPSSHDVVVVQTCDLCGARWRKPVGRVLLADPELRVFCHEHGVDVLLTPYWELDFVATDEYVTVRSTDPWEVALEVTFDGETLELVVDEGLTVLERNRRDASATTRTSFLSGNETLLPATYDCVEYLRRHRWPDGVTCPQCDSQNTTKLGTTSKEAQRYTCQDCDSTFNDLTGTIFAGQRLSLPEMFHIIRERDDKPTTQISEDIDRSYKAVLAFVHKVRDAPDEAALLGQ